MITQKESPTIARVAGEIDKLATERKRPVTSNNPTWRMVAEDAFRSGCLINAD